MEIVRLFVFVFVLRKMFSCRAIIFVLIGNSDG